MRNNKFLRSSNNTKNIDDADDITCVTLNADTLNVDTMNVTDLNYTRLTGDTIYVDTMYEKNEGNDVVFWNHIQLSTAAGSTIKYGENDLLTNALCDVTTSYKIGGVNKITNTAIDSSITSATGLSLNSTQIADGTVSNTEFQYINSLSSNVQTQLDSKSTDLTNVLNGTTSFTNLNCDSLCLNNNLVITSSGNFVFSFCSNSVDIISGDLIRLR